MAELEIHQEHEGGDKDPFGLRVGVLASMLAVLLAIVTIASHRAHTQAVLLKADANDRWSYYQSKKIKLHNIELGQELVGLLAAKTDDSARALTRMAGEKKRYEKDSKEAQEQAEGLEHSVEKSEARALRYDVGEGLIEIGLVLSSLYFISKKKYFPAMGVAAGIAGTVAAIAGLLI
jgi:hypothetical protein